MKKKFFSVFDKAKFIAVTKITSMLLLFVIIINIIGIAYSRFESQASVYANANVAFFVVDSGTYTSSISISGLTPSSEPYLYTINVYNYDTESNKRTNVDLNYTISFETTTNMPLTYEVIRNETYSNTATDIISSRTTKQDENDVFYNILNASNSYEFGFSSDQMDQYTIVVHFPEEYKSYPDSYQGKIELISVNISAEQVV